MSASYSDIDIAIKRTVFTEKSFRDKYGYKEPESVPLKDRVEKCLKPKETNPARVVKNFILSVIPILAWLPRYKFKKWFIADLVSGLTVGVMHIPQGMSYAVLAGQHPIYGLYNSFFPVLLYCILGTSRHTAMGTFALTSLMLGNAMVALVPDPLIDASTGLTADGLIEAEAWDAIYDQRILLGSGCMFITGIFLFGLSILRVGSIVIYLSDPMISGFTFGAAFHILVSQFKSLLGVSIGSHAGPLNLIWVFRDLILALVNLDSTGKTRTAATVIISIICIIFLVVLKELNLRYKEKIPLGLPLPGELVVVIVGTGVSYGADLAGKYGVSIIGTIPSGIPAPVVPPMSQLPSLVGYAIPIAVVGYSVSVSIAKIFGNKFGYEIRPNQELVAYGLSNTICSFFSCFPAFPSMSRSCVQVESGGKTQVVGLISSAIILLVLLVIGPLFSSIPKACLASIVCVAMKGMLKRALDLKGLWKTSKLDTATWLVAAIGTLFLDVVYGLCVGVAFTLLCIVFRTQLVENESLVRVGETEMYRKVDQYNDMESLDRICVAAFRGPLHYVNKESFRKAMVKRTGVDPVMELARRNKMEKKMRKIQKNESMKKEVLPNTVSGGSSGVANGAFSSEDAEHHVVTTTVSDKDNTSRAEVKVNVAKEEGCLRYLIIDCAQISFMDTVGAKVLASVSTDYKKIEIKVLLANCSSEILRMLAASDYFEKFGECVAFVSLHDAVTFASIELKHAEVDSNSNEIDSQVQDSSASTSL